MPSTTVTFGITRVEGAFIESVEVSNKVDKKVLKGSQGVDNLVHTYNPSSSGSVKGHGELTVTPGIADDVGVSGLPSGGLMVIDEVKESESNDDFSSWDYSWSYYPSATSTEDGGNGG